MKIELRHSRASYGDEIEGYVAEVYRPEWNPGIKTFEARFEGYGVAQESGTSSDGTTAFVLVDAPTRADAERIIDRLPDALCDRYYPCVEGVL